MPEREWKHRGRLEGFLAGVSCSGPREARESIQAALFKRQLPYRAEAWGGESGLSFILLKRIADAEGEGLLGVFKVSHPQGAISEVLLHTDSEELISELEQKGIRLKEES